MKEYILITGASSGIGYEMAIQLAQKQHNLILAARSADKLEKMQKELKAKYAIEVEYMEVDLSLKEEAKMLYEAIKDKNLLVTGLINNAGVGAYGQFETIDLDEELRMIELNISSLLTLTKLFGKDMVSRKSGRIMNVASILSFLPFPYYSVYSATKAFVLAYTETTAAELEGSGVIMTALCPGTVETPFHSETMRKTNAMSANKPMSADVVAKAGVELFLNGKGKKIVGFMNWFLTNLPRITPDIMMMKIKKNLATIKM
ncbi:DltE Short-chain dehydrogenases of various substrate specificities [Spirosomataceae bacterium]